MAALLVPAAAAAQVPAPTPTATPPPPPPPPAKGRITLKAEKVHRDGERRVALTRDQWRVRGILRPYVAGQRIEVRFFRDGKQIRRRIARPKPIRRGRAGLFRTRFMTRVAGRVAVRAVHVRTRRLAEIRSEKIRVSVRAPDVGSGGMLVRLLQRGLHRLHYVVPRSGRYDGGTARAVMAYRKVRKMTRTYSASAEVLRGVLDRRGKFKVRYPRDGHHVEADISRQVLALIDGSKVKRIYHMSSGAPATPTVLGRFRVYRKTPGTNSHGMVHSSYFIGGYAIHGYASVPPWNASHGCLRVPIPNAWSIYRWVGMGTVVDVYP